MLNEVERILECLELQSSKQAKKNILDTGRWCLPMVVLPAAAVATSERPAADGREDLRNRKRRDVPRHRPIALVQAVQISVLWVKFLLQH
jgi:hypothetical protein